MYTDSHEALTSCGRMWRWGFYGEMLKVKGGQGGEPIPQCQRPYRREAPGVCLSQGRTHKTGCLSRKASPGAGLVSTSSSDFQPPASVCCFSLQASGLPQWLSRPSRPTPGVLGGQARSTSCPVVPKPQQPGRPGQPWPTGAPCRWAPSCKAGLWPGAVQSSQLDPTTPPWAQETGSPRPALTGSTPAPRWRPG